jgi:hypothetical protein
LSKQPTVIIKTIRDSFLQTIKVLQGSRAVVGALKMKSQRPDLMVIISVIFVFGAVATSLTANSEDKSVHPQVSQHIIR